MFRFLGRQLRRIEKGTKQQAADSGKTGESGRTASKHLEENISFFGVQLNHSQDLNTRRLLLGTEPNPAVAVLFIEGLVDNARLSDSVIAPLLQPRGPRPTLSGDHLALYVESLLVSAGTVTRTSSLDTLLEGILSGDAIVLIEGTLDGLIIDLKGWRTRPIEEPSSEVVIRGPREGFIESIQINTALLRRQIRDPNLVITGLSIGRRSKTPIAVAHIRGVADERIVEEVKRRITRIDVDSAIDANWVAEFIDDAPMSPVSTSGSSERPDVVAAKLLEGRVAIFVDGHPSVLTVPYVFVEGFQSPQDYYLGPYLQSIVRLIRYTSFAFSTLAVAYFVAVTSFHPELVPTPLLLTIAGSKEGTPFPVAFESALMQVFFEVLREASIRMPRAVGQTVSIVGALVIGQTVVAAGLVGAPVVIVTALTAISTFVVPDHTEEGTVARFLLLGFAAAFGLFGLVIGLLLMLVHLCTIRSFGVPILSPLSPFRLSDMRDTFVRPPVWLMWKRPSFLRVEDLKRQAFRLKPEPPENGGKAGGD